MGATAEVDPPRGTAGFCLDARAVRLRLPFSPVQQLLESARRLAPHDKGALRFATDYLDLIE